MWRWFSELGYQGRVRGERIVAFIGEPFNKKTEPAEDLNSGFAGALEGYSIPKKLLALGTIL